MKRSLYTLTAACAALILFAVAAPLAGAQEASLDDLIAMNLEAKGGEEALRAVESLRVNGTMTMGGGQMTAPFTWVWKAPNKLRLEFTFQGMTGIQAYDGETGWMVMPFMGKTDPEQMPADQVKTFEDQADFTGPFIDGEEKGYELAYEGEEEVDGTPAHKIKVTNKHGDVSYIFLDQDYGLEIQSEAHRSIQGQEVETTTAIGDYKEVEGIVMAHSYDTLLPQGMGTQTITFDSVELNVDLADSEFEMPAAEASEEMKDEGDGGR